MMAQTKAAMSIKPTPEDYDREVYHCGYLLKFIESQQLEHLKANNDSECVIFATGTFAGRDRWRIKDLIGNDRRLTQMLQELGIKSVLPVQRYSWPKIHKSTFATLFVSPKSTGKTYAHLLYAVSRCILAVPVAQTDDLLSGDINHRYETNQQANFEELINHPKYIVVCSSQDRVEFVNRIVEKMKEKAYGIEAGDARRRHLAPIARTLHVYHDNEKLASRCFESDILVTTPPTLLKCLQADYINFSKCKRVFFDDLDIALQLQNNNVRELIKIYVIQNRITLEAAGSVKCEANKSCQMHLFSQKWTELVKQFMCGIFSQRICLFNSLAEASIFSNMRFDIEPNYRDDGSKRSVLSRLISEKLETGPREKIAIVCRTDDESSMLANELVEMGHCLRLMLEGTAALNPKPRASGRGNRDMVYIISDQALSVEVEFTQASKPLTDIMHIIHAYLPSDPMIMDQRFRLSFKHIQDGKSGLSSTILIGPDLDITLGKQLYDLMSRSSTTLLSSKLILRDLISNSTNHLCWRWATTGLCRLEKLSRDDRFGSYCFDRHSLPQEQSRKSSPGLGPGMVRVTLTHVVSPSEFYFRFESLKSAEDGKWTKLDRTGSSFMEQVQTRLDDLWLVKTRSVPIDMVKKGQIFGVYFPQESRVDRVMLLGEPRDENEEVSVSKLNAELEYSKYVYVYKLDHGSRVDVFVKNLVILPEDLARLKPQCHRGFHLGYKPTDNEPNWPYKSTRKFRESVCSNNNHEIYLWLRAKRGECYWFEHMQVSRRLSNIDSTDICTVLPHSQLIKEHLADYSPSEPSNLPRSTRLETMCKWNHDKLREAAQYAFLRRDIATPEIYLLNVLGNANVLIRQSSYKKQLDSLELDIDEQYRAGKLIAQTYLVPDVYCIARIPLDSEHFSFNRVKILKIIEQTQHIESHECEEEESVSVYCLDHGDSFTLKRGNLFQATIDHIKRLPFQALTGRLANINPSLFSDGILTVDSRNQLLDATRHENNDFRNIKCKFDDEGSLYLFVLNDKGTQYVALASLLSQSGTILHGTKVDLEYLEPINCEVQEETYATSDVRLCMVNSFIVNLLRDIVVEELKSVGVKCSS